MWICHTATPHTVENRRRCCSRDTRKRQRSPGAAFGTTSAAANRSVGETDVRPDAVDRLRGRRPEIPARPEQVDLHALAAGPGVPKFLRVEGAFGGARPDIASLRCIAAVKVEARTSPRGEVS